MPEAAFPFVAVDVGNRRIKFGWCGRAFTQPESSAPLPQPESVFSLDSHREDWPGLEAWLESVWAEGAKPKVSQTEPTDFVAASSQESAGAFAEGSGPFGQRVQWWMGSVNRPAAVRLLEWIRERYPASRAVLLNWQQIPIRTAVVQPERVGVDRLLGAAAANRLRSGNRPAVVVDIGTAITVDWLSAEGVFSGGAILPGLDMAARALHEFTDLLPQVSLEGCSEAPPVIGMATEPAIRSGLFWGTLGAIRELLRQMSCQGPPPPQVFLTGGAGQLLAPHLGPDVQYLPHLTLAGIALAAQAAKHSPGESSPKGP